MHQQNTLNAFINLGHLINQCLNEKNEGKTNSDIAELNKIIEEHCIYNGWFTPEYVRLALAGIARFLDPEILSTFSRKYTPVKASKKVALIMAGNLPAVGFHDLLCVLISGHKALVKTSADDHLLIPFFIKFLQKDYPRLEDYIFIAGGKLQKFDAVIATGSNNTHRYFEFYFAKYPHLFRKNRSSIAVLSGAETKEELSLLANDIFSFYGLGCRNVAHLMVPENYSFELFFESVFPFARLMDNKKYANNYDYNRAVLLLNKAELLDNNFLLLNKSNDLHSPVAVINYHTYRSQNEIGEYLSQHSDEIQCVCSHLSFLNQRVAFGNAQCPAIDDFADGIDTMEFLTKTIQQSIKPSIRTFRH
jgi:hypothetical protein